MTEVHEANMFVVACPVTRKALLVDAATVDPRLAPFLERHHLELDGVFITHDHYDHIGGLAPIIKQYACPVYAGKGSLSGTPARVVGQGDTLTVGEAMGRVIALPGHTPTSIGLVLPGMVFTGDALFAGSIGGTTSDHEKNCEVEHIRKNIFTLPDDTGIHTGHGPSSTVYIEKNFNPFFV